MLSVEEIIAHLINSKANDAPALINNFSSKLKESYGADYVAASVFYDSTTKPSTGEESVLSSGKPYLDNSLSNYSSFPELIGNFKKGYKSCLMLPIKSTSKEFGVISILSKKESFFSDADLAKSGVLCSFIAHECDSLTEKIENVGLVGYFDASFGNFLPQCIIDKKGNIIRKNKSFSETLLLQNMQQGTQTLSKLFDLNVKSPEAIWDGTPIEAVTKGSNRDFRIYPKKISDEFLHVILFDTTETNLLKNRDSFFSMSQTEAFLVLDQKMKINWASPNIKNVFRMEREYMIGKTFTDLVRNKEALKNIDTTKGVQTFELEIVSDNGASLNAKTIIFKEKEGYAIILSRNTDRYIGLLNKNLEDILKLSGDIVITIDTLGYIKGINRSAEKLLKYKNEDVTSLSISSICADSESQMRITNAINIARANGSVTDFVVNFLVKGGTQMPAQQSVRTVYDETGKISGYMLISRELSTKRRLDELEQIADISTKEAKRYKDESEGKTNFINSISHDLKTPITSISGFAKLMLEEGDLGQLNEEQKNSLHIIIDESARLTQLIEKILDAAKLEAKKIKLDLQQINMRELGQNAGIKSLEEVATKRGLFFKFLVEYDVPPIEADPNRLIQVFVNLIGNAIKFTNAGGITVHITRNGKKKIKIDVTDTGIGISREDKAKLFKKFFQINKAEQARSGGSGTGLGLTIAKEIVKLHGGAIGIDSEPGKGTTFWFTLPLSQVQKKKKALLLAS